MTSPPVSCALPRRSLQFGASMPLSNSSTKSRVPSAGPNVLPSISKRSQDELKVSASDGGARLKHRARGAATSRRQRNARGTVPPVATRPRGVFNRCRTRGRPQARGPGPRCGLRVGGSGHPLADINGTPTPPRRGRGPACHLASRTSLEHERWKRADPLSWGEGLALTSPALAETFGNSEGFLALGRRPRVKKGGSGWAPGPGRAQRSLLEVLSLHT